MEITPKEEMFCQYYANGEKAGKSAVLAGYSPRSAHTLAWRLLKKEPIIARVKEIQREKIQKTKFETLPDALDELGTLYIKSTSVEQKRKILESYANMAGWNKGESRGTSGRFLPIAEAHHEREQIKKKIGYVPEEVNKMIDDCTTAMDFSEPPFHDLREKWRKEGLELDEFGTLTSLNQKGRDYLKELEAKENRQEVEPNEGE